MYFSISERMLNIDISYVRLPYSRQPVNDTSSASFHVMRRKQLPPPTILTDFTDWLQTVPDAACPSQWRGIDVMAGKSQRIIHRNSYAVLSLRETADGLHGLSFDRYKNRWTWVTLNGQMAVITHYCSPGRLVLATCGLWWKTRDISAVVQ